MGAYSRPVSYTHLDVYKRQVLAQLTGYALTRGMLCAMRRPALPAMEDLCLSLIHI